MDEHRHDLEWPLNEYKAFLNKNDLGFLVDLLDQQFEDDDEDEIDEAIPDEPFVQGPDEDDS